MKRVLKSSLSLLLAITIIFSSAYVGLSEIDFDGIDFSGLLTIKTKAVSSDACGENLTWDFDDNGTLTISGSGEMYDFEYNTAPWQSVKEEIIKVVISENVTKVGNYAFYNCSSLVEVQLSKNLKSIGIKAFYASGIERITIPKSLANTPTSLSSGPFYNSALKTIIFEEGTETILVNICAGANKLVNVVIPDSVTSIGNGAFYNCTSLKEMKLPSKLESIGVSSFGKCVSLTSIFLPNTFVSLGNYAFESSGIESITIPKSLINTPSYSAGPFYNSALKTIVFEEGTEKIPQYVCAGANKLVNVVIPDSVTSIGNGAFYNCTSLKEVKLPSKLESIGVSSFGKCVSLTSIFLPNTFVSLGNYAFESSGIESITIPKSLINTPSYSAGPFYNSALKTIVFEEGTEKIPQYVCAGANKLVNVVIPDSVTSIGNGAFYNCTSLKEVKLPSKLESIGVSSFEKCVSLTSIFLPNTFVSLGNYAFESSGIESITIPKSLINTPSYSAGPFYNSALKTIVFEEGTEKIPQYVCAGANKLVNVVIPDSVTSIGNGAFYKCTSLKEIQLPKKLKSIGSMAFESSGIESITIPKSLANTPTSLSSGPFYNSALKTIIFEEGMETVLVNICAGANKLVNVVIPDSVTSIGNGAFYKCTSLKEIELPSGLKNIGGNVFTKCTNITTLYLPDYLEKINPHAFDDCNAIIYCSINTKTYMTLLESNIEFYTKEKDETIFESDSYYKVDYLSSTLGNDITVSCYYNIKDGKFDSTNAPKVSINLPEKIVLSSVFVDSKYSKDYVYSDGCVSVNIDKPTGRIDFKFKVNNTGEILTYAEFSDNNYREILDVVRFYSEAMILNCDEVVNGDFVIYGKSRPNSQVVIYIDNVRLSECSTNRVGSFYYETSTNDLNMVPNQGYTLKVALKGEENNQKTKIIKCDPSNPKVTSFNFVSENSSGVKVTDLMDYTKTPVISYRLGAKTHYSIGVDNPENIACIFVVGSRKGREEKHLAVYDEEKQVFLTESTSDVGIYDSVHLEIISENVLDDVLAVVEDDVHTLITNKMDSYGLELKETVIDGVVTYNFDLGYEQRTALARDFGEGFVGQLSSVSATDISFGLPPTEQPIKYDNLDNAFLTYIGYGYLGDAEQLIDEVGTKSLDKSIRWWIKKTMLDGKITGLGGITTYLELVGGVNNTFAFTKAVGECLSSGFDYAAALLATAGIKVEYTDTVSAIDPSGYVYEGIDGNALEGVTATAYWIPYDSTNESFWNAPDESKAIVWDASKYDQVNPQVTDNDGFYAFYVPEGWWQVKFEKEGYETAYSEWMTVPPERTNVNIYMKSTDSLSVDSVEFVKNSVEIKFSQYVDVDIFKSNLTVEDQDGLLEYDLKIDDCGKNSSVNKQYAKTFTIKFKKWQDSDVTIKLNNIESYNGSIVSDTIVAEYVPCESHVWTIEIVEPTCTKDGYTQYTCDICTYSYKDIIEALGHNYQWCETVTPTTEQSGLKQYICLVCEDVARSEMLPILNGFNFVATDVNSYSLVSYNGTATEVKIPAKHNNCAVTTVGNSCFKENENIIRVDIPVGVTGIGYLAFYNCTALETVSIPATVTSIGAQAFYGFKGTIICQKDSYAHQYAIENGIDYIIPTLKATDSKSFIDFEHQLVFSTITKCKNIDDIITGPSTVLTLPTASLKSNGGDFYGTGSTITMFDGNTFMGDYVLVINGDTNGDSVVDALDAAQVALVSNGQKTIDGAYKMAADSNLDDEINIDDYQAIVNKVVA